MSLTYVYGTVASSKTLNLLTFAHSLSESGEVVICISPKEDKRDGVNTIRTAAGLERKADIVLANHQTLSEEQIRKLSQARAVLVDEIQFFSADLVPQLRALANWGVDVRAYGLRTTFMGEVWPTSAALMGVCDNIVECESICRMCSGPKAVFSMRIKGKTPVFTGGLIEVGGIDRYIPVCASCFQASRENRSLTA